MRRTSEGLGRPSFFFALNPIRERIIRGISPWVDGLLRPPMAQRTICLTSQPGPLDAEGFKGIHHQLVDRTAKQHLGFIGADREHGVLLT